jgi:putative alpha-1,2-mannosidase
MAGNEDCGQMSAWYALSALGFYPVDPVSGNYVIGTPLFDGAEIDLGDGKRMKINVERSHAADCYVTSLHINGTAAERLWFSHKEIQKGLLLNFELSAEPNKAFGNTDADAPPG